jgi:hypothetical protein
LHGAAPMVGIAIRWAEGQFTCEFREEDRESVLYLFRGSELVDKEPVPSAEAAYDRARQLSSLRETPRMRRA